jgi:ABC-2 type transport system permease protein
MLWLATGYALFNLASGELPSLSGVDLSPIKIFIVILYFLGGFLLVASFQAGLGAVSTNMREGPQYAAFFTLPMVIPLWLINFFIETPNGNVAVILSLFPITAPLAMVQRIAIAVVPWWQLALSLVLLALGVIMTLWLASKLFRVNTLLAGTLPKLAELFRLLREA